MGQIVFRRFSFLLFSSLLAATAHADWLEASSDHFVIYGDMREKSLQEFAGRLERFDAVMAYMYKQEPTKPSPSNRVTIFVVASADEVQEVTALKNRYVSGVYIPRAGSSVAVIPRLKRGSTKFDLSGETILYHEYAHHFMATNLTKRAHPRWFVEGFAEFFAGVQFRASGDVLVGTPPYYRAFELSTGRKVPIRSLLDFDGGVDPAKVGNDTFYGMSWALFHYLVMVPERAGQTAKFGELLAAGRSALEAAEGAFGDLQELDRNLQAYLKRRPYLLLLKAVAFTTGTVTVRKLRPGEAAMMPVVIESRVGVSEEEAQSLLPQARKVAAQYPDDPSVLAALAEAEFDAGNDDAAITAADRALGIEPQLIRAHLQKGYALRNKVETGVLPKEAWKDVRIQFARANKAENDHPIPLVQFYLTYLAQGERPTKNAIDGLEWAMELAPFDKGLRWLVAQQMVQDERLAEAAQTLAPLAYSPHPGEHTDMARKLLEDVEGRLEANQ